VHGIDLSTAGDFRTAAVPAMKPIVSVRAFRAADLPSVLAIEKASFERDAWTAECFADYIERFPEYFLVAAVHGEVAGYAVSCLSRGTLEIASIAVLPCFRRRSVARRLLRSTISRALRKGVRQLWLMVRTDNLPAQTLYRSAGFARTRTVADYYEDGASAWRMRLNLRR
jgi:ribosomal-protein-alanine acetyltransferase